MSAVKLQMGIFRNGVGIEAEAPEAEVPADLAKWGEELSAIRERVQADPCEFVWINLVDPENDAVRAVQAAFGLSALSIDDAMNLKQRARIELNPKEKTAFIVMKVLEYVESTSDIETGQIALFIGPSYIIVVQLHTGLNLPGLSSHITDNYSAMGHGPLSVTHAIVDTVVDRYLEIVDEVAVDMQEIESRVFAGDSTNDSEAIYRLKRENQEIRRAISPLVSAAQALVAMRIYQIPEELRPFFHDIGDHLLRANEQVESMDTLLLTILTASISRQDLQQNQDMRKIAAWAAILAVCTLVAGIYGMNFEQMPELSWQYGYPLSLGLMGLVAFALYRIFKRSNWL